MRRRGRIFKKERTHLEAIDVAIIVVKDRKIQIEVRCRQSPESGFIANQFFGTELAVAVDPQINGQLIHRSIVVRELNVLIETGWSSYGPGNGGPEGLSRRAVPQHTRARLHLETVVVVVFQLRSHGQREPVIKQGDLILRKAAVDLVRQLARQEVNRRDGLYKIRGTHARAQPPEKVLLPRQSQMVEEVDVEGVASFSEFGFEMVGAVKVSLDLEVRFIVQHALPAG